MSPPPCQILTVGKAGRNVIVSPESGSLRLTRTFRSLASLKLIVLMKRIWRLGRCLRCKVTQQSNHKNCEYITSRIMFFSILTFSSARESVTEVLLPLVELIAEHTGTCVSVLVGGPPENDSRKFFVCGVHCGTAGPENLDWPSYDPKGFRQAITQFSSFLSNANSTCSCHSFLIPHRLIDNQFLTHVPTTRSPPRIPSSQATNVVAVILRKMN